MSEAFQQSIGTLQPETHLTQLNAEKAELTAAQGPAAGGADGMVEGVIAGAIAAAVAPAGAAVGAAVAAGSYFLSFISGLEGKNNSGNAPSQSKPSAGRSDNTTQQKPPPVSMMTRTNTPVIDPKKARVNILSKLPSVNALKDIKGAKMARGGLERLAQITRDMATTLHAKEGINRDEGNALRAAEDKRLNKASSRTAAKSSKPA